MYFYDLGYKSYEEYLKGPEWRVIKEYFYQEHRTRYECRICLERQGLRPHHRSYYCLTPIEFMKLPKKIRNMMLVYLCQRCNDKVHFYRDGTKVPLDYMFLWDREEEVYNHWYFYFMRLFKRIWRFIVSLNPEGGGRRRVVVAHY